MLALVCITRAENFRKKSLINYNIGCLKKALRALVQPTPMPIIENGHLV
jgi:Ras-related GTP-binding protein C/D